jgi:hypothetical protein
MLRPGIHLQVLFFTHFDGQLGLLSGLERVAA